MASSERTDAAANSTPGATAASTASTGTASIGATTANSAGAGTGTGTEYAVSGSTSSAALEDWARCECLMNARYHASREAFLDTVHRWFMFGVIFFGAAAFIKILPKEYDWLEALLSAAAALLGALDLTFDLSNRARAHSMMKRRYFELIADFIEHRKQLPEFLACLNRYSAEEEPVYNALLMLCWNAAQEMVHGDDGEMKDIPRLHQRLKNLWRYGGQQYKTITPKQPTAASA